MRRAERLLFVGVLAAAAYFHQGGGWNQNVRFALVRAIVEQQRIAIDDYLVYRPRSTDPERPRFERLSAAGASLTVDGVRHTLAWRGADGRLAAIDPARSSGGPLLALETVASSGDIAYARGHFHPNKAPGASLAAVPAYLLLVTVERALGFDLDDGWTLTVNAWLTSALSVGLVAAGAAVLFLRLARTLVGASETAALLAGVAFSFGTMMLPYSTMLFEHVVAAAALLAAWYFTERASGGVLGAGRAVASVRRDLVLAGLCAGFAVLTNYVMAAAVLIIAAHGLWAMRRREVLLWLAVGAAGPGLLLCAYHAAAFGAVLTTSYAHQNPLFADPGARLLGVFGAPRLDVLLALLASPYRGLFYSSPVLLLGVWGWLRMLRGGDARDRARSLAMAALFLLFLVTNASFNGWSGGWCNEPRYLAPAMPFLALPIAVIAPRCFKLACVLAAWSVAVHLLFSAVDPQAPVGEWRAATVPGKPLWRHDPLFDYTLPLFVVGRAAPILDALAGQTGRASPLASLEGPVSVNPIGIQEGALFRFFPPGSPPTYWSSLNAGELLLPRSRWSVAPLVAFLAAAIGAAFRASRR